MSGEIRHLRNVLFCLFSCLCMVFSLQGATAAENVLKATLGNGLKVVIVKNPLAPVVATSINYDVGSNEAPRGFPGMAHATEHMMFRGSPGLSQAQLANIGGLMGGNYNANTRETMTQYYYVVPANDLDVALHIESARMQDLTSSEADWAKERGAIEQEVAGDHSSPIQNAVEKLRAHMFAGTPYAHTPLGTRPSFDKTTMKMLRKFHNSWYVPNNATLIVVGNVVPEKALAKVKAIFGTIPAKKLPARPKFTFAPVTPVHISEPFDKPYTFSFFSLRVPGFRSADFPALKLLADAMNSHRYALYSMVAKGRALAVGFEYAPMRQGGMANLIAIISPQEDPAVARNQMQAVVAKALKDGIPADLVAAAKLQEKRTAEQRRNSIAGQASYWADTTVEYGLSSPAAYQAKLQAVTVDDVNRVARKYLKLASASTVELVPKPGMKPAKGRAGGAETIAMPKTGAVKLPAWAEAAAGRLDMPKVTIKPVISHLKNGITLYVLPTKVSNSILLAGYIRNNADMQSAEGKEGVGALTDQLLLFGTTHLNRMQFQAAADAIGAEIQAGTSFSAQALAPNFDKAVALLADAERNPGFPEQYLDAQKPQLARVTAQEKNTPDYKARMATLRALVPANDPVLREETEKSIMSLTRADLLAYHKAVYRPDMTAIVVVGNISPEKAKAIVEKHFGDWQATGPKPDVDYPAIPDNKPATRRIENPVRQQDKTTLSEMIRMPRKSPDYYALRLGNAVLGEGTFSTKLMHDLRTVNALTYGAYSSLDTDTHRSQFSISFGADPDNTVKATELAKKDVRDMQDTPVSAKVLRDTKARVLRRMVVGQSSVGAIAGMYLNFFDEGLPAGELEHAAKTYVALTAEEVQAACKKWLRPDDLVRVTVGPVQDKKAAPAQTTKKGAEAAAAAQP